MSASAEFTPEKLDYIEGVFEHPSGVCALVAVDVLSEGKVPLEKWIDVAQRGVKVDEVVKMVEDFVLPLVDEPILGRYKRQFFDGGGTPQLDENILSDIASIILTQPSRALLLSRESMNTDGHTAAILSYLSSGEIKVLYVDTMRGCYAGVIEENELSEILEKLLNERKGHGGYGEIVTVGFMVS